MWFKNLHLYRVHDAVTLGLDDFEFALEQFAFRPVSDREMRRVGWTTPASKRSTVHAHEIQGHRLIAMMRQERLLPAAVVNEEVNERAEAYEQSEGQPLSRRERQLLKEQVLEELLPQAFTRSQRVELWWDTARNLIGINASSRKRAEEVLDLLRQSLGSLKVTPLATKTPPARGMTQWLSDPGSRPASLLLGDRVELRAAEDDGVIGARSVDLDSEEMQSLLEGGRQVSRLSLGSEGQLRAVLHDDLALKSLQFDDALLDEASQTDDGDDPVVRLETDFALMTAALGTFTEQLIEWLGGEADPSAPTEMTP
ncbi:recombination-associated protein RdgC [Salinicola rhizosphaerae]|uniref:Recombination-associated protein RdgC n=1 Tax=Salinicola rhizosphaerae TaxID=1443141 RepID=A0ABQ3ECQ6_9GAMM|nr:recombination-associated protein RdgC [Salinicola rhizosphaerae]GHB30772.1 recombination-associated protein RdgC [Salinicola rhizosphaerae]